MAAEYFCRPALEDFNVAEVANANEQQGKEQQEFIIGFFEQLVVQ